MSDMNTPIYPKQRARVLELLQTAEDALQAIREEHLNISGAVRDSTNEALDKVIGTYLNLNLQPVVETGVSSHG